MLLKEINDLWSGHLMLQDSCQSGRLQPTIEVDALMVPQQSQHHSTQGLRWPQ